MNIVNILFTGFTVCFATRMLPFVFQTIDELIAMRASLYFSTHEIALFRFLYVLHETIWVDEFAVIM